MTNKALGALLGAAFLLPAASDAATVVFRASGADVASVQGTVDDYRAALGALNANQPVNAAGGRREVNWDGVPDAVSDPVPFPEDGFNRAVPGLARGVEFVATGASTATQVSASGLGAVPAEFGEGDEYTPFSPLKLFEPVGGSTFDTLFFNPAIPSQAATTRGLGVVFTGLVGQVAPSLTFYGRDGGVLATESVAITSDAGLAFLGVLFDDAVVARVGVDVGDEAVTDDFIYGEPAPVPVPAGAALLVTALAGLGLARRRG